MSRLYGWPWGKALQALAHLKAQADRPSRSQHDTDVKQVAAAVYCRPQAAPQATRMTSSRRPDGSSGGLLSSLSAGPHGPFKD